MDFKIGDQAIHGLKMPRNTSEKYQVYEMPVTIVEFSTRADTVKVSLNSNPKIKKFVPINSLRRPDAK